MTVIPRLTAPQLRLLHALVREGTMRATGYHLRPMRALVRQGLAEPFGSVYQPTAYAHEVVVLPEMALPAPRQNASGWMRSTFAAREYPSAIWIRDEAIVGPFCIHCGNPFSLHGDDLHCPDRVLHPLFPGPSCKCHGEASPA